MPHFCRSALALSLVLALTACQHFEPKPLSPETTASAFAERNLHDPGLQEFFEENQASRGTWTADRLALAAAYFHPDVALARAEAEVAAAAIETAEMRPNPLLTFGPQFASSNIAPITPWFLGMNVSIPVETAGKRMKRTEQAVLAAEAARWRVSSQAWVARSRVRSAMLDLHAARENIRLLETEQALHQEAIQKLTAQMEAGDVSPFELTQARLMLDRTRLSLRDAQRNAATAEARLAAATGVPLAALREVALDFSPFARLPIPKPGQIRGKALTQRADLMALLCDYAASEAALKLELARQYPDLNVVPGYDYNSGQNRWQLGWNFQLPLNRNRGPIAAAEARRLSAEKRFLAQQATIEGELDVALAAYEASRAKVITAAQLASQAQTAAATTQRMVEAGDISALELTRRKIEASAADISLMTARIEAQVAAGALEDATQSTL